MILLILALAPALAAASCDSASVLFLVDSSHSIGAQRWPKLVDFVKNLSDRIPTSSRVGFLKFSDEVSGQKWVGPNWSIEEFKNAVPSVFDEGLTNTPSALREAKKMFEGDSNKKKIAVLITDGIPIGASYDAQDEALDDTKNAVKELRDAGVTLKVFAFGPEISHEMTTFKEWVLKPKSDFLYFYGNAAKLGEVQLTKLVDCVCNKE